MEPKSSSDVAGAEQNRPYYDRLANKSLAPLWERLSRLVTREPHTSVLPQIWQYREARELLIEAGRVISEQEAERRVLILENPGLVGKSSATDWLYAGLQLILPGEVARAHRHIPAALRFVLEGDGAYTAVDGEKYWMAPGDLVLTPSWTWHDHGHEGEGPFIWLDILDLPATGKLSVCFSEHHDEETFPTNAPTGLGRAQFGRNMRPMNDTQSHIHSPVFHYPYNEARSALETFSLGADPDPSDGWKMEYINPQTGSAVMPTISTYLQLLPKGFRGTPRRTTEGAVLCVKEGRGRLVVGSPGEEVTMEWAPHDVMIIPNWMPSRIEADEQSVVFWGTDRGVQESLGFYREEK